MSGYPHHRGISLPNQTIYINNLNDKLSKDVVRRYVQSQLGLGLKGVSGGKRKEWLRLTARG